MSYTYDMKSTLLLGLFLSAAAWNPANAQKQLINSGKVLQKGIAEYEDGEYKNAIAAFEQIQEGDTNYYVAQYELALSYLVDSQFEKSIALNKQLLKDYPEKERQIMLNIGVGYSNLGNTEKAIAYFDSTHVRYPNDHRPFYEKGVAYFQNKEYDKAIEQLQTALLYNPLHPKSHRLLGTVYAIQGRLTEAMIAMQGALSATSDVNEALNPIVSMNSIAIMKDEAAEYYRNKKSAYHHELFDEIDELIASKLALGKDFKISGKIDDAITRQLQVIFEKLKYDEGDHNFVMQYYVPLLLDIREKDLFSDYMLFLFSGYGIESIEKHVDGRRGKQKIESVTKVIDPYRKMILGTRELKYSNRTLDKVNYLVIDGAFIEAKPSDNTLTKLKEGPIKAYEGHVLLAEGKFNAKEQKEGLWKYYYPNGVLRLEETYVDGKEDNDKLVRYYPNGNIDYMVTFNKNNSFQNRTDYFYNGQKASSQVKDQDGNFKATYFHPNGKEHYTVVYDKDNVEKTVDGSYKAYYSNGKLQKEYAVKNDKLDGAYKEYYDNGIVMIEAQYILGKLNGTYKKFFKSGRPDMVYQYKNGERNGLCQDFYDEKESYFTQEYKNDLPHGLLERYNKNKVKYATVNYNNGVPVSAEYKNLEGKVVYTAADKNGLALLETYNEYGTKTKSCPLNKKGQNHGLVKTYHEFGGIESELPCTNGVIEGTSKYYHYNGALAYQKTTVNGVEEGAYASFTDASTLSREGFMHENELQDGFQYYYSNGKPSKSNFFNAGERSGPETTYFYNEKIDYVNHYDKGMLMGVTQYDTTGKWISKLDLPKGEGVYMVRFPSGNTRITVPVKYGWFNGPYLRYMDDKTIIERSNFEQGQLEGLSEDFHPNGKIWITANYHLGEKYGTYKKYNVAGQLIEETEYIDDEEHGPSKVYCGDQLRYLFNMTNGERHGESVIYGEQGKIAGILYYDRGLLIGYSYMDKNNNKVPMIPVQNGTATVKTFYPDGAKAMEFNWLNNLHEGNQKLYFSNGKLAEERGFKKGMYDGVYNRWNEDGSKLEESFFKNDMLQDTRKEYDKKGNLLSSAHYIDGMRHGKMLLIDGSGKMKEVLYYYGLAVQ